MTPNECTVLSYLAIASGDTHPSVMDMAEVLLDRLSAKMRPVGEAVFRPERIKDLDEYSAMAARKFLEWHAHVMAHPLPNIAAVTWEDFPEIPGSKIFQGKRRSWLWVGQEAVRPFWDLLEDEKRWRSTLEGIERVMLHRTFPMTHYTALADLAFRRGIRVWKMPSGRVDPGAPGIEFDPREWE